MSTLSTRGRKVPVATTQEQQRSAITAPITVSESSALILALVRIFTGYLWFQQLYWKLPPSFDGLHTFVVREAQYTFIPGYSYIIQHVFLPNFGLLGAGTWAAELIVALCLLFGVFSRFGGLLATILALQLYVGLSTSEWYWTYGTIVLLGLVFLGFPAGRRLGVDQWLAPRLQAAASNNRAACILSWFV
jgi:thiosulfate dehydrogenase [quinone] large subunit